MQKKDDFFHFKQFKINHSNVGMKVGTDGVLVGAWTELRSANRILDVGTGSGLIALMLAQRSDEDVRIDAIEIDKTDFLQAEANILNSPWPQKINVFHSSLQEYHETNGYDLIVSNPPFFINSFVPPDGKRVRSRHTTSLSYDELLHHTKRLLTSDGRLSVILPNAEGSAFRKRAALYGYHCSRQWSFLSRKDKPVERWLLEFSRVNTQTEFGELIMFGEGNDWSDDYKRLTETFYLKL